MGYCTQSGGFRGNPLISTALNRRCCTNSTVFVHFAAQQRNFPLLSAGPEQLSTAPCPPVRVRNRGTPPEAGYRSMSPCYEK